MFGRRIGRRVLVSEVGAISSSTGRVLEYSPKQKAVLRLALDPSTKFLLLDGSVGAGKTSLLCMAWAGWVKSGRAASGGVTIFAGQTMNTIYRNIVETFKNEDIFGEASKLVVASKSATTFDLFGETIVCISSEDPRAVEKLKGVNAKAIIIDELATMSYEFFDEALNRLRVGNERKLFASFNPGHPKHWLKTRFIDRVGTVENPGPLWDLGWRHVVMWMDDNPGLPEDYKINQRATKQGKEYLRDLCGEWVAQVGRVYDNFDERIHVVPHGELPMMARILAVGMDYGDTAASGAVILGVDVSYSALWVLGEWGYEAGKGGAQLAPAELGHSFAEWLKDFSLPNQDDVPVIEAIFIDPGGGGTGFRNQLLLDELMYPYRNRVGAAPKKAGSVLDGIRVIRSLFATRQLRVSDSCEHLIEEFDVYAWDKEASERRGEQVLKKGDDHYCDALRYAVSATFGHWQRWLRFGEFVERT